MPLNGPVTWPTEPIDAGIQKEGPVTKEELLDIVKELEGVIAEGRLLSLAFSMLLDKLSRQTQVSTPPEQATSLSPIPSNSATSPATRPTPPALMNIV